MIHARSPKFFGILWILLALMSSASRCFRDPCEGKWSDASSFDVRGVEWVGNKAGVLGVFTKREKCPNLLGYTYQTLYSRDVMFFVDPSTIHQDENGWWIVEADSVWIIHQEPSIGGGDLWKDPRGRGWWLGRYLYDDAFNRILDSLPCGYHTYPLGDTLYYLCFTGTDATPDTVGRKILSTGQSEPLFTYPIVGLLAADPLGRIYITGDYRLLRWEGADSFTVIDSPVVSFGLKNDTLVTWGIPWRDNFVVFRDPSTLTIIDTIPLMGSITEFWNGSCYIPWRFHNDAAFVCPPQSFHTLCTIRSGGLVCTDIIFFPRSLWP